MIQVAILGFGVVGGGVAKVLEENAALLRARFQTDVSLKYILDIRDFTGHAMAQRIVRDFSTIEKDPEISVVFEAMGGVHPALEYSLAAIRAHKSVITSNKELVAHHGHLLLREAAAAGVRYLFEASVGGGIPIIRPLSDCLAANRVTSVTGIMNGTTNYILTQMEKNGASFSDALSDAQARGYAERDPSADIDGVDTCRKLCILADLAFGYQVDPARVLCEGIRRITEQDISDASDAGYRIKLLGHVRETASGIVPIVAPFFIKKTHILSGVSGVFNGIGVVGNMVGETMFFGHGAGSAPTASAMVGDLIEALERPSTPVGWSDTAPDHFVQDAKTLAFSRYARFVSPTKAQKEAILDVADAVLRDKDGTLSVILKPMDAQTCEVFLASIMPASPESVIRIFVPGEYVPEE